MPGPHRSGGVRRRTARMLSASVQRPPAATAGVQPDAQLSSGDRTSVHEGHTAAPTAQTFAQPRVRNGLSQCWITKRPTFSPWRTPWTQPVRKCMPPNTRASTDSAAACDKLVKLRSIVMLGNGVGLGAGDRGARAIAPRPRHAARERRADTHPTTTVPARLHGSGSLGCARSQPASCLKCHTQPRYLRATVHEAAVGAKITREDESLLCWASGTFQVR